MNKYNCRTSSKETKKDVFQELLIATPAAFYLGIMSGTSLDGVDAVLAKINSAGQVKPLDCVSAPYTSALRKMLLELQSTGANEIHREHLAANALAMAYIQVAETLLAKAQLRAADITAIGAHGQTIRHQPSLLNGHAYTHQTLNAALLAEKLGIAVVADFRQRDVAAGGQGAPLVPAFHAQQFSSPTENRAVLNLGGIANLTLLPKGAGALLGFDTGPGNLLLDGWMQFSSGKSFDDGGSWGASGNCDAELLQVLLCDPYFQVVPPKSTGRDYFHLTWLKHQLGERKLKPEDIQATLMALTSLSVCKALKQYLPNVERLIICGGGANNTALISLLRANTVEVLGRSLAVDLSSAHGVQPQWVEGLAFAWLAWAHINKRPANVPAVTGAAGPRILGTFFPN